MSTVAMPEPVWSGHGLQELVVPAVAGDAGARAAMLVLIRPMVLRYCRPRLRGMCGGLGSAEDVTQEVCVAVLQALSRYQPTDLPFKSFVLGIAAKKVADAFRAHGRDRAHPVAEVPEVGVDRNGPEDRALRNERVEMLGQLLDQLSDRHRQVLRLRLLLGMSAFEVAAVLGSTAGAVRVEQHRAMTKLRQLIRVLPRSADAGRRRS